METSAKSNPVDIERCARALKEITVGGIVNTAQRRQCIADAIAAIHTDGATALLKEYIGVKVYAGFGEQREDHTYGSGPRHGNIVFRIERVGDRKTMLSADHVYLLECIRDWRGWTEQRRNPGDYRGYDHTVTLPEAIRELAELTARAALIADKLAAATVESHELAGAV